MAGCVSCGVEIPDGQRTCSVCYGDPFHGSAGILLAMIEQDYIAQEQEQEPRGPRKEPNG